MFNKFLSFLKPKTYQPHIPYVYCFLRTDLPLIQQIVQSAHATWGASQKAPYFIDIPHLILIGVPDKSALEMVITHLESLHILFSAFYEPDNQAGLTSVCTVPILSNTTRNELKDYSLWVGPIAT